MSEERKMILQMLQDGEIDVDEAERLMEAVEKEAGSQALSVVNGSGVSPKRIAVRVVEEGRTKVNVKIPFSLVRIGLKLGQTATAVGAKYAKEEEEAALLKTLSSLDVDEIIASLDMGDITLPYTVVDMDEEDSNQHISVIVE